MRDGLRRELLAQKVIEREVISKVSITEQEVTDFYAANRAQFNCPEDDVPHRADRRSRRFATPQVANRTGDDATTPQAAGGKAQMLMERLKAGRAVQRAGDATSPRIRSRRSAAATSASCRCRRCSRRRRRCATRC